MRDLFDNFRGFLDLTRGIQGDARTIESEDYARMARHRAMLIERIHLDRAATGDLGDATLGTLDDAHSAGLLNRAGLFLGALQGRLLYLNADGHHLVFARAGGGKARRQSSPMSRIARARCSSPP